MAKRRFRGPARFGHCRDFEENGDSRDGQTNAEFGIALLVEGPCERLAQIGQPVLIGGDPLMGFAPFPFSLDGIFRLGSLNYAGQPGDAIVKRIRNRGRPGVTDRTSWSERGGLLPDIRGISGSIAHQPNDCRQGMAPVCSVFVNVGMVHP